ncbi:hypothetical protein BP5796_05104 [Coleophoma crateriformis]|uniref:C2H2-type domain-containing protein n=1 Tax=Coleophoma crateriformis TaxID=565419 RepID=A0A3D8S2B7_9HELO|nr:hypothetical protein BP5796_05104 [Coleophoma crateriformis]
MPFECSDCERSFSNQEALCQHCEAKVHQVRWYCACEQKYTTAKKLRSHIRKTHPHYCNHCVRIFDDEYGIEQHKKAKHAYKIQQELASTLERTVKERYYQCQVCEFCCMTTDFNHTASLHYQTDHQLPCKTCSEIFETEEKRAEHGLVHKLSCIHCEDAVFSTKEELECHDRERHEFLRTTCKKDKQDKQDKRAAEEKLTLGGVQEQFVAERDRLEARNYTLSRQIRTAQQQAVGSGETCIAMGKLLGDAMAKNYLAELEVRQLRQQVDVLLQESKRRSRSDTSEAGTGTLSALASDKEFAVERTISTQSAQGTGTEELSTSVTDDENVPPTMSSASSTSNDDSIRGNMSTSTHVMGYSLFERFPKILEQQILGCFECGEDFATQSDLLRHLGAKRHETEWLVVPI